ncbi:uncharacterized protein LOC125868415 [Solanum stenotomum]|uniref:uncharacterized protein LOC125868415 n=1 Tax=Solanum stenotomum TaxID=172797 RepID=UPI0020D066B4|nr:uncharacterized protein LOC125868415 [Solanum stenotomum]
MICPKIQKDIVIACKIETIKGIIKELNGDYFSLLVDESFDISCKDQMVVVLRYVDRRGIVMERLLDIVHVKNTSALSLKETIANLLSQHSLSLSYVHGQCYDGASNMQGDINGLTMLIKKESRSAYFIYCFAHQLQLTLVGVSKRCLQVVELVHLVSNIFNVLAASYKRMDDYRESQKKKFKKLLIWFSTIMDILDNIVETAHSMDERFRATEYIRIAQTYEVTFMLHLMKEVLGITNDFSTCLQKKEQDIANAKLLVKVAKRRLQKLRKNKKWDLFVVEMSAFYIKYNIVVPNFDESYVNSGRSRRKSADYTIFHHYRVEVFCKIIHWQLQELNDRFDEVTTKLLYGVACLNPVDSFSSFDIQYLDLIYADKLAEHPYFTRSKAPKDSFPNRSLLKGKATMVNNSEEIGLTEIAIVQPSTAEQNELIAQLMQQYDEQEKKWRSKEESSKHNLKEKILKAVKELHYNPEVAGFNYEDFGIHPNLDLP